jgi:F-type H+-transporting ATPase subunit delta
MNTSEQLPQVTFDVDAQGAARVYAEALLNEAEKRNQAQETLDELDDLVNQVLRPNPDLEEFLCAADINRDSKAQLIQKAFAGRTSELVFNFLIVVNDHERLNLLLPILDQYREMLNERQGRIRAFVRTAAPLPPEQEEQLRNQLRGILQREPLLEIVVDPELLGGLSVRVADWLYDATVRTRLETWQDQIIESSSHEIKVGRDRFSN